MDFFRNELKVQFPKFWLDNSTEYFTKPMPLELTKYIMDIIFWKINWDFGADARVIADISTLSLGSPAPEFVKKIIDLLGFHDFYAIKTFG
jgi:hypothetical protein